MVAALLGVAVALLGLRLFRLIDRYAVNVLFWDQWDLFDAFFDDANAWQLFRWQFGPHRQGIAFPLVRALMDATAWNTRAESFLIGALLLLAAALALWLRRRLLGALTPFDLAIPLLLLSPAQYAIFAHIPNASHGAAPLLLLVALGCACTLRRRGTRCAALVALDFLLVHTGFGIVAGALAPLLLASECAEAWREQGRRAALGPALCTALSLAALGVFLAGYHFDPATEDFAFPSPDAGHYPHYAAAMLAYALGLRGSGLLPSLAGALALAGLVAVSALHALRLFARRGEERQLSAVILAFSGFGLLFCAATAVGRISLGLATAQSSRYLPLVAPALLGLYLQLCAIRRPRLRLWATGLAALAIAAANLPLRTDDERFLRLLAHQKQRWVETYRETGSIRAADERAGRRMYPNPPEITRLEQKLAWLRERRLNLFSDASASTPRARTGTFERSSPPSRGD